MVTDKTQKTILVINDQMLSLKQGVYQFVLLLPWYLQLIIILFIVYETGILQHPQKSFCHAIIPTRSCRQVRQVFQRQLMYILDKEESLTVNFAFYLGIDCKNMCITTPIQLIATCRPDLELQLILTLYTYIM